MFVSLYNHYYFYQIFHDIIEARTKEIQLSLGIADSEEDEREGNGMEDTTCDTIRRGQL